jgi:PAS domain S-box-containing protein
MFMRSALEALNKKHAQAFYVRHLFILIAILSVASGYIFCIPAAAQITVHAGIYDNPPKVILDEQGKASGLFPELLDYIASEEGWSIDYVPGSWTECMTRLKQGEIDLMMDVAITEPRRDEYAFNNETVLANWGTVYTKRGLEIRALPELKGLRVAVMRDSTHTVDPGGIIDLTKRFGIDCTFIEMEDYLQVFEALDSGEADAGIVNRVFGMTFQRQYRVESTPIVFNPIELRFAMPIDGELTPLLISRLDMHLAKLKDDPDSVYYRQIEEHLLLAAKRETLVVWPDWLLPSLTSAAVIIATLIIAFLLVRRESRRRAQAQEAYRQSQERFALAMRGANDGLWDWNLTTGHVYYSPRWASMLGYHAEELQPTIETFRSLVHPDDIDQVRKLEGDYISGKTGRYQAEFRMLHKDGITVDILSRAFLVRDSNKTPVRVVGTHVDITKQKQAALMLEEAKEQAEAADRLKSAFLATMSHELRTPLNSIIGFNGILLQQLPGPLNQEQTKQLKMVRKSAQHLLNLINDVLDISKIEAGQVEVFLEVFDLKEMMSEIAESSRPFAKQKGIALHAYVDSEIGMIKSDQQRLSQIVTNLISNAMKFTETGYVRLSCKQLESEITITVEDTGIGIKKEDFPKLFSPFQQVDTGLTRKYEGTGLGLSICKKLTELLGGRIEIESTPGQGSLFRVIIPRGM